MTRPRLIPVLLLKQGVIVRSQRFTTHQVIGNPVSTIERLANWNVDELVLLDISATDSHDLRRDDLFQAYDGSSVVDVLRATAEVCYMPLTVGGGIRTLEDLGARLDAGADKCVINTAAVDDPGFITSAAERFGSQAVVVSIDVLRADDGSLEVHTERGRRRVHIPPEEWAREVESRGAGEIMLGSIDRDGAGEGYDLDLIRRVTDVVDVPVIAVGGVGKYSDLAPAIVEGGAAAAAAANIYHFFELSYPWAKQSMIDAGVDVRGVELGSRWLTREPSYDVKVRDQRHADRLSRAESGDIAASRSVDWTTTRWCTRCVYPAISAAPMEFDEQGVCTGCQMADVKSRMTRQDWDARKEILRDILEQHRSPDGSTYDCVIPVSGGKDSYFQAHVIRHEFGLKPLLVTYNGNNWTPAGWRNMNRMREVMDVDHILYSPSVDVLQRLNRLAFTVMGDMNWHAHVGITTAPVRIAAQHRVPLVIWGEHGYLDLSGQFSMNDFPEMSYRDRLEHFARGFEWNYFLGMEGLTASDLMPWKYPSDEDLFQQGTRGIYIGNYIYWEANEHAQMVIDKYGFEVSDEPFDRTYRRMSNLDDMHENGVHDYLKFVKFGYGRATDHACKDIRAGLMSRDEAIEMVLRYDHVKPRDLVRWLDYTGMDEATFDRIADTFRDPRVWRKEDDVWVKDNLWD